MLEKIKKLTDIALTAGFLGFIYLVLAMTYTGPVQKVVEETRFTFGSYEDLSKKFEKILQENLYKKYGFINLNGRIARLLRLNSLNGINKMKDGYLTRVGSVIDVKGPAEKVIELNKFLADRGIPFIYILAPRKSSMYDAKFAPGYVDESYKNIDNMINALKVGGVNTINMAKWFKDNRWQTKDIFWKTDHHWKPKAGLAAARCTMELLQQWGAAVYDKEKLKDKNYEIIVLKNWFLGSQGKRVGVNYAGVEDIPVYQPKFKTKYFYAGLKSKSTDWSYSDSILGLKHYSKKKDYFESDPYYIYLQGNYPIQIVINTEGSNNKKVLMIGDSFKQPWIYFLTTQFQEVYPMDLRNYTDGTFVQYVEEIQPDIVLMCSNERGITEEPMYTFGVKEYLTALEKPIGDIQELGSMEFRAEEKNNNKFEVVCSNLEPNQTYTLTIDSTELSGVKKSFVQMTLQNMSENKSVYNRYFNANSRKPQKWIFTTPEKAEDTYGIYLYAGTKEHTANIGVNIGGIKLRKGILDK